MKTGKQDDQTDGGDVRAREVVRLAADKFRWGPPPTPGRGRGRGFAFARYKNLAAYCAVAVEVRIQEGRARLVRAAALWSNLHLR